MSISRLGEKWELSPVCRTYRQKEFLCDGKSLALRRSVSVMCQDTPLTHKHSDVQPSASLAEKTRNGGAS